MSLNSAVKIHHNFKGNRSHRNLSQHHKDSLNLNTLQEFWSLFEIVVSSRVLYNKYSFDSNITT